MPPSPSTITSSAPGGSPAAGSRWRQDGDGCKTVTWTAQPLTVLFMIEWHLTAKSPRANFGRHRLSPAGRIMFAGVEARCSAYLHPPTSPLKSEARPVTAEIGCVEVSAMRPVAPGEWIGSGVTEFGRHERAGRPPDTAPRLVRQCRIKYRGFLGLDHELPNPGQGLELFRRAPGVTVERICRTTSSGADLPTGWQVVSSGAQFRKLEYCDCGTV